MSTRELTTVAEELVGLTRQHVRVACVQCDAAIHHRAWLTPSSTLRAVWGRGGTDLRPPFAEAELETYRPDMIVYFTDGYGEAPATAPTNVEVLWVLTGENPRTPASFGRVVRMRDHGGNGRIT